MNAEDIAKALKCCYPPKGNNSCDGCPYDGIEDPTCTERNIEYHAGEIIESLLSQLDAAIAGQETLQKALIESQRREKAAIAEVCKVCECLTYATGNGWKNSCDECEWCDPKKATTGQPD